MTTFVGKYKKANLFLVACFSAWDDMAQSDRGYALMARNIEAFDSAYGCVLDAINNKFVDFFGINILQFVQNYQRCGIAISQNPTFSFCKNTLLELANKYRIGSWYNGEGSLDSIRSFMDKNFPEAIITDNELIEYHKQRIQEENQLSLLPQQERNIRIRNKELGLGLQIKEVLDIINHSFDFVAQSPSSSVQQQDYRGFESGGLDRSS